MLINLSDSSIKKNVTNKKKVSMSNKNTQEISPFHWIPFIRIFPNIKTENSLFSTPTSYNIIIIWRKCKRYSTRTHFQKVKWSVQSASVHWHAERMITPTIRYQKWNTHLFYHNTHFPSAQLKISGRFKSLPNALSVISKKFSVRVLLYEREQYFSVLCPVFMVSINININSLGWSWKDIFFL